MKDKYMMDSTKMMYHPERITKFLQGERIPPLHIDVGLSKGCNIRCIYCFGTLQENKYKKGMKDYFPKKPLLKYMRDAGTIGVKSMGIIGEAEPTLNPYLYDAIDEGTKSGIDMALGTNGILFDSGKKGRKALENLKWIRFNISAASKEMYKTIHNSDAFDTVIEKIKFCVKTKEENGFPVTIGLQSVLVPEDSGEMVPLAKLGKELGVDYFVIKQCGDSQSNVIGTHNRYNEYQEIINNHLLGEAELESTDKYNVIVKWGHIQTGYNFTFDHCVGMPFVLYSSGEGKLFGCGMFFDRKYWDDFLLGDLTKESFIDIINSKRYEEVYERHKKIDCKTFCYNSCRTNKVNEYIWNLTHRPPHVNFV
jgi:MoaA/NifB/PqqE/SkfB family radical SAM enzyme